MNLNKTAAISCILILVGAAYASVTERPLEFLYGEWAGTGKTSGLASEITLTWQLTLGGRFTTIQLHNRMSDERGQQFVFEGIGYYQADDEHHFSGVWVDSRGDIHPLTAALEGQSLLATWGTEETELGRSVYRLRPDGDLEVTDSVMNEEGEWRVFGQHILERISVGPKHAGR